MSWEFDNSIPIYIQLVDRIKLLIISGKIRLGEKLSSVRDLAEETGVNPNTMQRALAELEREGLIYSVRTSGRFVTEDAGLIKQIRDRLANEKIESLFDALAELGYGHSEIVDAITERVNRNE